mgnify:CR=1 FL=1
MTAGPDNVTRRLKKEAVDIFMAGLSAVEPRAAIRKHCKLTSDLLQVGSQTYDLASYRNIFIIGAGKATAPMAMEVENILGERLSGGVISVKYHHGLNLERVHVIEAGHPVPDQNGITGAVAISKIAESAGENDLVICLISGGGSALMVSPEVGISLQDKQATVEALLNCGASIHEINAVRKHISRIKGGRLARAIYPAGLVALILSDVVGDDLEVIASGPTVGDTSTFSDCLEIIDRYRIRADMPESVIRHLTEGRDGKHPETTNPGASELARVQNLIVGSNMDAIRAASQKAEMLGYHTLILSSMIEGDTTQVARVHAAIAKEIIKTGHPASPPACILSGGETTVQVKGQGLGGRNQEFALAGALEIDRLHSVVILSGGTDGTDGPTDAAGAIADGETLNRASRLNLDPKHYLANNDSFHFFQALDDLLITGPTRTNVMDLRIILATGPMRQ